MSGRRVWHAGDTERIPEMKTFNADIALVPLGQTYTMGSVQEAAEAVLDSGASIAIPIHYGMYEGSSSDADTFATLLAGRVRVEILKQQK
jgi:L-ascorbate metabolism protein UlaG (beta-lactamase superfamily)